MLLDLSPLIRYRDYRLLFIGQLVSFVGSMLTYVALPYQLYHLTGSSLAVGLVGIAQLAPLLFTALVGGAYADALDRRKLLIVAELVLVLCSAVLAFNSMSTHPQVWVIYLVAAIGSSVNGFHTPAQNAMTPRLVDRQDIPAVSALNTLKGTIPAVAGPALGGILIASAGLTATYFADVASFAVSLGALWLMKPMPASEKSDPPGVSSIVEGLKYARSRDELLGTYVVDFVAVVFGMPMALFPAVAEGFGGAKVLGLLYSAPAVGALIMSLLSAWTKRVHRHGAAVILAASTWGLAIVAFGFTNQLWLALFFLALAGAADMVSGLFRSTIWNGTIPDHLRGRLAGIEMVSYMSGPLLGNAESGLVASLANTQISIVSGGILCVVGVIFCAFRLPQFRRYDYRDWLGKQKERTDAV
jgi:MFS family permease